ncbi:hypothetical protein BGZ94_001999 [Podila epigama]|nr:hypothetical protein BGZ94_001999 [Podila epigama]
MARLKAILSSNRPRHYRTVPTTTTRRTRNTGRVLGPAVPRKKVYGAGGLFQRTPRQHRPVSTKTRIMSALRPRAARSAPVRTRYGTRRHHHHHSTGSKVAALLGLLSMKKRYARRGY